MYFCGIYNYPWMLLIQAEQAQTEACEKFEQMSEKGKEGKE